MALALLACLPTSLAAQQTVPQTEQSLPSLPTLYVSPDALDPDDSRVKTVSTATKTALRLRDIPQTIDTLEMSKSKVYGQNDLSILLDGTPGITTSYDTRGEGITVRGFSADSGDIYRDGIRASGQIRRSTANVERIEILKGPASVLYGRGTGGGTINLVSKQANFDSPSSFSVREGSWNNRGGSVDLNQIIHSDWVIRLSADYEEADSFRRSISNTNRMISPSVLYDNHHGLTWLGQYTYDKVWRQPDQAPSYDNLPAGVDYRIAFSHPQDYIEDRMQMFRSVLGYEFSNHWAIKWTAGLHEAHQDFDHLYAGRYNNPLPDLLVFSRAWQKTENISLTNTVDLSGKFASGPIQHDVLIGLEYTKEQRNPKVGTASYTSTNPARYPHGIDPHHPVWIHNKPESGPYTQINRHTAQATALYLQDMLEFTPQWKMLAGLRFDRFEFNSHNKLTDKQRGYNGNSLSPRVGLIWQPLEAHSFYTSYSKNFAPYGGRGMISVSTNDAVYDDEPQYSRQLETGLKSDWLGGELSTQIAFYNLEKYNIRYQVDPTNDPYHWASGRQERSRGIEASASGKVAKTLYIRSGMGGQEAKIIRDVTTPALVGKQKTGQVRRNGHIFLRYVPTPHWYSETGVTYRGPIFTDNANTTQRAGYTRWDASVGYRALPWTVTLAVTNLTDKRYWRSTNMPGAPRNFLLSVNWVF